MRNTLAGWFGAGALLFYWAHTAPPHVVPPPGAATLPAGTGGDDRKALAALTALPAPHAASPNDPAHPAVVQVATGTGTLGALEGWSCFRLQLDLNPLTAKNVYTIFGHAEEAIRMPAALQVAHPFGVNIGGSNRAFWAVNPLAQYDSWLTVGITEGDAASGLSTVGIPFEEWTGSSGLLAGDGGVFWTNPDAGPGGSGVVVAQITVKDGSRWRATLSAQGRSVGVHTEQNGDWTQTGIVFTSATVSGGR